MDHDICPVCGKGNLESKTRSYETEFIDRSGQRQPLVVPELTWQECNACGEGFLDDVATRQLETARRVGMGLLSASEIRELRQNLDKTQAEMSRLLGIGEKTYCRWESGVYVQSTAFDNYLRLVREFPEAAWFLEEIQSESPSLGRSLSTEPLFPSLRDTSSLEEPANAFTRLLVGGRLLAARTAA